MEARALAAALPSAEIAQADLSDWDSGPAMIDEALARVPNLRVLINNASVFRHENAQELAPSTFDEAMQVNAGSPARMAQAFLHGPARSRDDGGRCVIHVLDQKLENPNPDFFSYTMSKHALASTVDMLAMNAPSPQDRVYGLAPGAILPSHDQTADEARLSHRLNLLQRMTPPEEVADAALFLADGSLESGQVLFVDSGQHLLSQPRDVIYLAREGAHV